MSRDKKTIPFSSLDYWCARHEQYLYDPRGVGNAVFNKARNEEIYKAADTYMYELITKLVSKESAEILDLGCGVGMLADAFIRKGCSYTGIDISKKAIEIARERHPKGKYLVGNIDDIPLNGKFDIIFERTVFIHLVEDAYWEAAIGEVSRLLNKETGIFILHDHIPITPDKNSIVDHVKLRLYSDYEAVFKKYKLTFNAEIKRELAGKMSTSPNTHFVTHAMS